MQFPLAINFLFHKNNKNKQTFSKLFYSFFCRDIHKPLFRGLNIPVYFYDSDNLAINFEAYEKNIIVIFVDDNLVVDSRNVEEFFNTYKEENNIHFIFVSLTENFYKISSFSSFQFIRLNEIEEDRKQTYLFKELLHDIVRFLLHIERIKIFISHSKRDGLDRALELKCQIEAYSKLDTFFDASDIQDSIEWEKSLQQNLNTQQNVLLAIQTDSYSSREWCKKEVLIAKKNKIPILILKALKEGEDRSFPYMYNVPTIKCKEERINIDLLLMKILLEVLRFYYQEKYLKYFVDSYCPDMKDDIEILSYPPELLTVLNSNKKKFIYPDPPLGYEELEILSKLGNEYKFFTPLTCEEQL